MTGFIEVTLINDIDYEGGAYNNEHRLYSIFWNI
jgi:hypothetical protein